MKGELTQKNKREGGQIIVLFAVSLVAILVVAALAVDGGMLYAERRHAQNAADAASMAGGSSILNADMDMNTFVCPTNSTYNHGTKQFSNPDNIVAKAYLAAKNSGGLNNFPSLPYLGYVRNGTTAEDYGLSEKHGIYILCDSSTGNKYVDINVKITAQIKTAFAHLVFPGAMATTDEAVTRVIPGHNMGYGHAIVSLSETCQNTTDGGTYFSGSAAKIKIKGSGTHSNSCLVGNGAHLTVTIDSDETLDLAAADSTENPSGVFGGKDRGNQPILTIDYPAEPVCGAGAPASISITNNSHTLAPGNYSSIKITGGNVTLSPGLYCMTGDISITGGVTVGDGVTFFLKKDGSKNTSVTINGKGKTLLAAPTDPNSQLFGMLFFMDDDNHGTINLVGNNGSYFAGVLYAPNGFIDIGGTSTLTSFSDDVCELIENMPDTCEATTFSTQIIANSVRVSGDGQLDILYNDSALPGVDTNMYLLK